MISCPQIGCGSYNYDEGNNCTTYLRVTNCHDYRKRRDHDKKVCADKSCGGHGTMYHGHCRDDARSTCRNYKQQRKAKNMTATEVLSRNARFKHEYVCDWSEPFIKTPKTEKAKMNEFDNALTNANNGTLTTKINTAKDAAVAAATRTKNTVVRVKVGRIAIAAIKSAIKKTPGVPVYAKMLLDSEYADIVIGAVVPILVPMITTNKKAIRLSEDVNIAGGVAIADKLTFIDDFVAQVIAQVSSAIGPEDLVDDTAKDKL